MASGQLKRLLHIEQNGRSSVGSTRVQATIDGEPSPDEQAKWDSEYHGRLFHWAIEQVRPTIQESTLAAFWRAMMDQEDRVNVAKDLKLSVGASGCWT